MKSVILAVSLFGIWFGVPSDKEVLRKGQGKVTGQFVVAPAYEGVRIVRHGSRWTVCGTATGAHLSGRIGPERFIVDRKSLIFSGDPVFSSDTDDKEAFETLWKTRCTKR